jgi:predicted TIM-barrel enzyme
MAVNSLKEKIPIYLGSGISEKNIHAYKKYIIGIIVSTSLKKTSTSIHKVNIKPYKTRVDISKVKKLRLEINKTTNI